MCSNYRPVTRADRLLSFFGAHRDVDRDPVDVWPLGLAPFFRLSEDGSGNRICDDGVFGLLPHFATEMTYGRHTYNARSETVHKLASFKHAWAAGQRCIVPAEVIFEPCWETGKAVRWAIQLPGQVPMGIAGIYRSWRAPDGRQLFTFAMLTVNADGHPVLQRFHRPEDEKRMVVILPEQDYGAWLSCGVDEAPAFVRRWEGPLDAYPAPLPPRAPSSSSVRSRKLPKADEGPDAELF
jgi:putative SOS response-associated peptidase YedK